MRMPTLTCNRCGKQDTMMVDAPRLDDPRVYCVECYAILFPPGWTDEYQPITEPEPDYDIPSPREPGVFYGDEPDPDGVS